MAPPIIRPAFFLLINLREIFLRFWVGGGGGGGGRNNKISEIDQSIKKIKIKFGLNFF